MSKIVVLNGLENEEALNDILNQELLVYEDVQGSKIWLSWLDGGFIIRPKNLHSEPINMVDLAMQNYYNPAVEYFKNLDNRVKSLMPKNWSFCFEYFPDNQPANIEYQKVPKNRLVLTSINKGGKYESSIEELLEYSRLFDVDCLPVIFDGSLSSDMKEAILYFLSTSESDLEYVFGEKTFSFFFYKLLNSDSNSSFLMEDDFQKNLEKIVIRIKNKNISFDVLNPLYQRISDNNSTEFVEIYTLILINFLNFCQSIDIDNLKLKGSKRDEMYIYLISKLFNLYIDEVKEDLINFDFTVPSFFDREKFKINKELINDKLTKELINESPKLEYIFKVILGSFSKKRKKPIGLFTEATVILFNGFVDRLNLLIDKHFNKMREFQLVKGNLLDFSDYFSIQYDKDGDNQVYPDVFDEIQKPNKDKKKKGTGLDKKTK